MIGGRRPGESGAFRAGLELVCDTCDASSRPAAPPKPESRPTTKKSVCSPTNRRKATRRIPSNRMAPRSKSNAVVVLLLAAVALLTLILVAVLAAR